MFFHLNHTDLNDSEHPKHGSCDLKNMASGDKYCFIYTYTFILGCLIAGTVQASYPLRSLRQQKSTTDEMLLLSEG